MLPSEDPHLVERIARLAAFHDLPTPVLVQMTLMVSELQQREVSAVHAEVEARVAQLRAGERPRPALRLVGGGA